MYICLCLCVCEYMCMCVCLPRPLRPGPLPSSSVNGQLLGKLPPPLLPPLCLSSSRACSRPPPLNLPNPHAGLLRYWPARNLPSCFAPFLRSPESYIILFLPLLLTAPQYYVCLLFKINRVLQVQGTPWDPLTKPSIMLSAQASFGHTGPAPADAVMSLSHM